MESATYQAQDSVLTLEQGLEEYFEANPGLTRVAPETPEAELFLPHDACHVLFGTSTSLAEEAMTDIWTIAGADVGLWGYSKLMRHAAKLNPGEVLNRIGYWTALTHTIRSVGPMFEAWRRGRRMTKPWPFRGYATYLQRPLGEIRSEFGIEVFLPDPALLQSSTVKGPSLTRTRDALRSPSTRSSH